MPLSPRAFAAATEPRPNVVLVMTDDQGYGDLGLHDNPHIRTPNLDRFAREGVQFSRFYVSSVCAPTRAALLTGRYSYRTGVIHTSRGGAKMHGDELTMAELLRDVGYRTGIFGKWHLGDNYPMRPSDQGFEEALIHKSGGLGQGPDAPNSYFDPRLWHNNEPLQTKGYCTDVFFDAALEFIEQNREKPFFVYLPTNAPHAPLDVSPSYSDPYKAMGLDDTTAKVYGMVENIDDNFARLLAALERLDLRKNTLVIFLTDNGAQQRRFNGGLRDRKGTPYEGGIRVPAFLQWPSRLAGGRTIDQPAAHIDLLPTLLDVCDVAARKERALDGASVWPLLAEKPAAKRWPERTFFLQVHRGLEPKRYQNMAVVTDRFKLVGYSDTFNDENLDTSGRPPRLELYDLAADRAEAKDIAAQNPAMVERLQRKYNAWFDDMRAARNFQPGVIHIGSEREPVVHLSRYQDGNYLDGVSQGWPVKVLRAGRYAMSFFRGKHEGPVQLVVKWDGDTRKQPLPAGEDTASFVLPSGDGVLDIWIESADGARIPFTTNDNDGDVLLRRL